MTTFLAHVDWDEGCFQVEPYEQARITLFLEDILIIWGAENDVRVCPAPGLRLLHLEHAFERPLSIGDRSLKVFWAEAEDKTVSHLVFGLVHSIQEKRNSAVRDWRQDLPLMIGAPALPVEEVAAGKAAFLLQESNCGDGQG